MATHEEELHQEIRRAQQSIREVEDMLFALRRGVEAILKEDRADIPADVRERLANLCVEALKRPPSLCEPHFSATTPRRTVAAHDVIVHGVEHEQYFQGCGLTVTDFRAAATGVGADAAEAFEDALEQLGQAGWILDDADDWPDAPTADDARLPPDAHEEMWVYVSVRVR